tara:strand:+ start:69 stop:257 length:189 start_codon:yes stop_codon:yes gene_type:complete
MNFTILRKEKQLDNNWQYTVMREDGNAVTFTLNREVNDQIIGELATAPLPEDPEEITDESDD